MNVYHNPDDPNFVMPTTEEGWREILPPERFRVARGKGTERAFSNEYWDEKRPGVYTCYCCGQELFDSRAKFDSGTGWPSFHEPIRPGAVAEQEDNGWFMRRTETVCTRCGAHLGHLFDDAPSTPTGLRYCMNSAALRLKPEAAGGEAEK